MRDPPRPLSYRFRNQTRKTSEMSVKVTYQLAQADMAHLHLTGLILMALVQQGILTDQQAQNLVQDAKKILDEDAPMQEAYRLLSANF